jgi:hypothetical protein
MPNTIERFPQPLDSRHPWRSPYGPAALFAIAPAIAVGTFSRKREKDFITGNSN